ncbi:MAG: hypothetical protein IID33_09910 [Planctomycetes bacterium]|nr:hypothetical protein [Planctomycetota bacterium]
MIKTAIAVVALTGIGLVGYFYLGDKSNDGREQKAKRAVSKATHAVVKATDSVVEGTVSGAVKARLMTTFGLDTARYLHVTNHDGQVVVYGLLNPKVTAEQITAEAQKVPGVKEVQLLVHPWPRALTGAAASP